MVRVRLRILTSILFCASVPWLMEQEFRHLGIDFACVLLVHGVNRILKSNVSSMPLLHETKKPQTIVGFPDGHLLIKSPVIPSPALSSSDSFTALLLFACSSSAS